MRRRLEIQRKLRKFGRLLPRVIREPIKRVRRNYINLTAPLPTKPGLTGSGRPVVVGLLRTASGIGQSSRLCRSALHDLGLMPETFDLSEAFEQLHLPEEDFGPAATFHDQGPLVIHLNPPELGIALRALGRNRIRNRLIIGCWVWELPVMPPAWRPLLKHVHEVWVPSKFCARAIQPWANQPVRVVPYPVRSVPDSGRGRSYFGLPADAFIVLAMADAWSSFARKNPIGAVTAFQRAFGKDERFVLCLKVAGSEDQPKALCRLRQAIAGAANIVLLQGRFPAADIGALIRCVDTVLSLHRSEGFGLVLGEAMRLAKPVIATDWSGNRDFMTVENAALVPYRMVPVCDPESLYPAEGQEWAEPDIEAAADWLRRLADDPSLRIRIGRSAEQTMARQSSLERYIDALGSDFIRACGGKYRGGTA